MFHVMRSSSLRQGVAPTVSPLALINRSSPVEVSKQATIF
ncbi:unannotated protein [freshwater metagenome]|uniref:Unannotated protein n=1 Tax=freshwater metagenome TaxID=449393 RepID=A0A6J6PUV5_9ZZZZ